MKANDRNISWENEVIFYRYNYYGSIGMPSFDVAKFSYPKKMRKYNKWLGKDYKFFHKPYIKKWLNRYMHACEQLFDKYVLEIKKNL